ncbi:hypothetical protein [Nocardia sp. NPDC059228]|uniref:hypothetical protein n=1 Tax=Nocardia sp. NPDC059228 TaxID=3346777 RepID=UPI00368A56FF
MAIAEVDQALAGLDADHGEIAANLAELQDDPGVRFLDGVPPTGVSAARYGWAYELLHSAPCDLAVATRAVAEFQRAITEKTARP